MSIHIGLDIGIASVGWAVYVSNPVKQPESESSEERADNPWYISHTGKVERDLSRPKIGGK